MAKILIVDDEKIIVRSLKIGLQTKGYDIPVANNAKEALQYFNANDSDIDLVVTDYLMPDMTGIELVSTIRKTNPTIPCILMTAYGKKSVVVDALKGHLDSYIEKPFTAQELHFEIEKVLKHKQGRKSSTDQMDNVNLHVHQINNPLAAISGAVELASLSLDDKKGVKKHLAGIQKACQKIHNINMKILNRARINQGLLDAVNVRHTMEDCLSSMQSLLIFKNIKVDIDLDAADLEIRADRFGLEQIFNNLFLNAVQAMEDASIKKLCLKTERSRKDCLLAIQIIDSGCGIPTESLGRVFANYFTSKKEGSGLGLSVVKSVVENHGWHIDVESESGKGSTFTVTLPIGN